MGTPMPQALRDTMTPAQHAATGLRTLLQSLGADEATIRRVVPRADLSGTQYVYVPALPLDIVQHIVRLLPVPESRPRP